MKRPLVPVALVYVGGVVTGDCLDLALIPLFLAAGLVILIALGWPRVAALLLGPALWLTGALNQTLHRATLSPRDLRVLVGDNPKLVEVRGRLVETPFHRVYQHDGESSWRTLAVLDVAAMRLGKSSWRPAQGRVAVSTPGTLDPPYFGGRTVRVGGVIQVPPPPVAAGLFDYAVYLQRQDIHYQLRAGGVEDWSVDEEPGARPPLADRFGAWAKRTLALGLPVEDEPLRLLWAMSLGWKTALTGEVSEPFMRSGTMHIFAISGLHIALIAEIFVAVLRVVRIPRAVCAPVVLPLIWLYTGLTGWQASAVRSTVMMSVIILGWSLRRPSDLLNSLAAAGLIILVGDPQQLFQAGFQLSFFVVLSLALFSPLLERVRRRLLEPDPLLPAALRPRWQRALRWGADGVTRGLTTSLAAWLGSIPLVAYYFHLVTPISLLANLIVVPLSGAALACNLGSLAVGAWWPALAEVFNHSAWFWMRSMMRASEWAARCPGGAFAIPTPTLLELAAYYLLLVIVLSGWLWHPRGWRWASPVVAALGVAWTLQAWHARGATRLTVLPLHGGHAIFVQPAHGGDAWLIDCGNESAVRFNTKPFLQAQGVNRLPWLVLTHGDVRQVGGAEVVARAFSPRAAVISTARFRSTTYREVIEALEAAGVKRINTTAGEKIGPWEVLHPPASSRVLPADDAAMVLRGTFTGTRVLLLSDLGRHGQNVLAGLGESLRADIVVAGLPQNGEPLGEGLLDLIQPQAVIVADSEFPATRRAGRLLLERLARRQLAVISTREHGGVTLVVRQGAWEIRSVGETLAHSRP
jgi:ComEC/Rec2-related protein